MKSKSVQDNLNRNEYDAIVIGSGIGGLTAACLLTKVRKKKVLVIEQHWELGGLTHEFNRKGKFSWDVGLHYVGKMEKGNLSSQIFSFITNNNIKWNELPYEFEKFIYPDLQFSVPSNKDEYITRLIKLFPSEAKAIRNYFTDLQKAIRFGSTRMVIDLVPSFIGFFLTIFNKRQEALALSTTKDYLDANFKDPKLKSLLVSQWGDYGLPPSQSSFLIHAIIACHYFDGAVFPEGGASRIAAEAKGIVESTGGLCLTSAEVTEVFTENGKVTGVAVQSKRGEKEIKNYKAPIVISSTGALHTYTKLIPNFIPATYLTDMKSLPKGKSAVTLYIGFKEDPSLLGFKGENNWIYESFDHDEAIKGNIELLNGKPKSCYLSFPSLKNKSAKGHTAEIISFAEFDWFRDWEKTKWRKRGEDYEKLKRTISDGLIQLVEKHYPGFKNLIEFQELSTPLTYLELAGRSNGEFYGLPSSPEKFKIKWLGARTPVENFYLAGSDVFSLGIIGAMMGGVAAAAHALKPAGFPKILKALKR